MEDPPYITQKVPVTLFATVVRVSSESEDLPRQNHIFVKLDRALSEAIEWRWLRIAE